MNRIKKLAFIFASLVFLVASLCPTASALEISPHASLYLSSYGVWLEQGKCVGCLRVEFTVVANESSDYVGITRLAIYEADGTHVTTIGGSVANGMLRRDTRAHMGEYYYYGEPGVSYYAVATVYAERDGGYDTRDVTTKTRVAPTSPSIST